MECPLDSILADADGVDADAVLDALAHEERREALSYLAAIREPAPLDDVASCLDTVTVGATVGEDGRLTVRLHHLHLPKLAAAGLVTYDPATKVAEVTDLGEQFSGLVESLDR